MMVRQRNHQDRDITRIMRAKKGHHSAVGVIGETTTQGGGDGQTAEMYWPVLTSSA